jgi:hypothetical protein
MEAAMERSQEVTAVLASQASHPRRPKPTDQHLRVRFKVLPDDQALLRLPRIESDRPLSDPDPEDGTVYAPYCTDGGMGITGDIRSLAGHSLHCGDLVKMEIRAEGKAARVRCLGQVAWVRVNRDAGLFRAGVCFVGVDPRDLAG